jgi:23S rRNA (uracil1939-C5)-methyltransferase
MATRAAHVLGLEGEDRQVIRATANAAVNNTQNAEFRTADLASLSGRENWMRQQWDRILLDPARSGAAEVLEHIDTLGAERIVYVSCHPGTLARDTEQLVGQHGYELEAAGIIDMFPHTAHVESIAVFVKRRKNK